MMTDRELEQLASNAAQNDGPVEKWLDLSRSVALIAECRQWRKNWDALMVLIAQTVGDEDDREMAEAGEMEEFDPWHALRAHRQAALSGEDVEALRFAVKVVGASEYLFSDRLSDPRIKAHVEQCRAALTVLTRLVEQKP